MSGGKVMKINCLFISARRQPEQILPAGPGRGRLSLLLRGPRQWRPVQAGKSTGEESVRGQEQQVGEERGEERAAVISWTCFQC